MVVHYILKASMKLLGFQCLAVEFFIWHLDMCRDVNETLVSWLLRVQTSPRKSKYGHLLDPIDSWVSGLGLIGSMPEYPCNQVIYMKMLYIIITISYIIILCNNKIQSNL